jgi:hypothetical protein
MVGVITVAEVTIMAGVEAEAIIMDGGIITIGGNGGTRLTGRMSP